MPLGNLPLPRLLPHESRRQVEVQLGFSSLLLRVPHPHLHPLRPLHLLQIPQPLRLLPPITLLVHHRALLAAVGAHLDVIIVIAILSLPLGVLYRSSVFKGVLSHRL